MLRNLTKWGLAAGLSRSGLLGIMGSARRTREKPLIVGYHRVVQDFERSARTCIPSMLISARMLERQLDWLRGHYRVIALEEMANLLAKGRPAAGTVAITFDDGYRDVYENAFPILERRGIPATIFAVADLIGTSRPLNHDRLYGLLARALWGATAPADVLAGLYRDCRLPMPDARILERASRTPFTALRLFLETLSQPAILSAIARLESRFGAQPTEDGLALTWDMIDEMRPAGVTIGSHGKTHALLTHESRDRKHDEISGSRQMLEARLKTPVEHFAYPDGKFDSSTVIATAAAGYRFAYTACGHRDPAFPLLTLPRRILWEHAAVEARGAFSTSVMDCLVSGTFDALSPCRQTHGPGIDDQPHLGAVWSGTTS